MSPSSISLNVFDGIIKLSGLPAVTGIFLSLLSCLGERFLTADSNLSVVVLGTSVVVVLGKIVVDGVVEVVLVVVSSSVVVLTVVVVVVEGDGLEVGASVVGASVTVDDGSITGVTDFSVVEVSVGSEIYRNWII